MPMPAKRLKELDILRALGIFLIVFYHLPEDLALPLSQDPAVRAALGYVGLFGMALFFFLSGFSIDLNNRGLITQTDVSRFFYKRMKRIYPLYWVSLIISFLAILVIIPALHVSLLPTLQASLLGQNGLSQSDVMICLLGAQVLLYPRFINMPNRWFIGTILICYLLYPPIAYFSKNDVRRVILVSAILFLCLVAAYIVFNVVGDVHLYIYFCVFTAGIIANRANLFYNGAITNRLVASCALIVTFLIFAQAALNYPRDGAPLDVGLGPGLNNLAGSGVYLVYLTTISLLFVVVAFYVAKARSPRLGSRAGAFFFFAAVASYSVFLFSQQFVVGLQFTLQRVLPFGELEIAAIVVFVGLPVLFAISYYEQRAEPKAVNKILEFIRPTVLREHLRHTLLRRER
jgi:peptidoglycan/LPS O-acetylase OafA/YrhL